MDIFKGLRHLVAVWEVQEERFLTREEIAAVKSAFIVESGYGKSVEFRMRNGKNAYTPLSVDSFDVPVGKRVSLKKMKILRLSCPGNFDIYQVKL